VTDAVPGRISPTSVPDSAPLHAGSVPPAVAGCSERAMPIALAIPWIPVGNGTASPESGAFPVFIAQGALVAVHEHCAANDARLGLLTGQLYRCSKTGVAYLVIESTIRVPWLITGHDPKPIAELTRVVAQSELAQNGHRLLGWYKSASSPDAGLSPRDAELHRTLLSDPWEVALLVRSGSGPAGALFRQSSSTTWRHEPLSFYELLDEGRRGPAGEKRTVLTWGNYRAGDADSPIAAVAKGPTRLHPTPAPRLLIPDESDDEDDGGGPPRRSTRVDVLRRRVPLVAAGGVVGLLALWGLAHLARLAEGRPAGSAPATVSAGEISSARVDRLADTVALALVAFDLRVQMFERRQMACVDVARGLVELEERWMAYNVARTGASGTSDASETRDAKLYTSVNARERRFERSACPRP